MAYDFSHLSGADFEELVHDLLEAEWKLDLEGFAAGRDGGVDLRREDGDGLLIVQCKNYQGSGYAALRSRVRDSELTKVRKLRPNRYVLVTSVDLTVHQKDELFHLLAPMVREKGDIIGGADLATMLGRNEAVVRRHHKLWLTSAAVMQRVLHAAEHAQTEAEVDRIQRKLALYVQTDAFPRAIEMLRDNRVVIISGEPGIGKSTLADMILLDQAANGYEPAVIRSSLAEGRRMASSGSPAIFYFDDFLGQTYLGDRPDFLGRREDADLVDFMGWVRDGGRHRFVLTTREHVLSEALMRSERLRHSGLGSDRCVLTLRDISRTQRARILYNHLYFSSLPEDYKAEALRDDFFLSIIDSARFNPRIVQWLSSRERLRLVPVERYQDHVRDLMSNPTEIWRHAFDHELSQAARDVLLVLYSFTYSAFLDDLERSFDGLHARSIRRLNQRSISGAFRSAMKELDGSLIIIKDDQVRFVNPSVADFVATVFASDPQAVIDVIDSATLFCQASMMLKGVEAGGPFPSASERVLDQASVVAEAFARLVPKDHVRWMRTEGRMVGRHVDPSMPQKAARLVDLQVYLPSVRAVARHAIAAVAEGLTNGDVHPEDVPTLLKSAWSLRDRGTWADVGMVVQALRASLPGAYARDWLAILDLKPVLGEGFASELPEVDHLFAVFLTDGLSDERSGCDDAEAAEDLRYTLERIHERHGVDLGHELNYLADQISELERPRAESVDADIDVSAPAVNELSSEQIKSMFSSLLG